MVSNKIAMDSNQQIYMNYTHGMETRWLINTKDTHISVAVPGFLRGGGANSKGEREKPLFSQFFPKNCMKLK